MRKDALLFLLLIAAVASSANATTYTIPINMTGTITPADLSALDPPGAGDQILIAPGARDYLVFDGFTGSSSSPLTIKNGDGKVTIDTNTGGSNYACLEFIDCEYLVVSGTGSATHDYGIELRDPTNNGIAIKGSNSNFELAHIEIHEIPGIGVAILPGDADGPSHTFYDLVCHDLYIHDIGTEAMYLGTCVDCGTGWIVNSYFDGVEIFDCLIENIGWDGIQLANAIGDVDIHDNQVFEFGEYSGEESLAGGCIPSGIVINGGSTGDWHRNWVGNGKGVGNSVQHDGSGVEVFNNVVVDIFEHNFSDATGHLGEGIWWLKGSGEVFNNTVARTDAEGFIVGSHMDGSGHSVTIHDNIFADYGDGVCSGSTFYCDYSDGEATFSDNLDALDIADVKFKSPSNDDFHLLSNSPAVNQQSSGYPDVDFDTEDRPVDVYADRGAFEYIPKQGGGGPDIGMDLLMQAGSEITGFSAAPNPFNPTTEIKLNLANPQLLQLGIYDISGRLVRLLHNGPLPEGVTSVTWDGKGEGGGFVASGVYFATVETQSTASSVKLVLLK